MNFLSLLILFLIILLFGLAFRTYHKESKKGGCGCGCEGCNNCPKGKR